MTQVLSVRASESPLPMSKGKTSKTSLVVGVRSQPATNKFHHYLSECASLFIASNGRRTSAICILLCPFLKFITLASVVFIRASLTTASTRSSLLDQLSRSWTSIRPLFWRALKLASLQTDLAISLRTVFRLEVPLRTSIRNPPFFAYLILIIVLSISSRSTHFFILLVNSGKSPNLGSTMMVDWLILILLHKGLQGKNSRSLVP